MTMRRALGLIAALVLCQVPATADELVQYKRSSLEPIRPMFALSANSDGSIAAKANLSVTWDLLSGGAQARSGTFVHSVTIAPTLALTDNSNTPIFTIGSKSPSTNFGGTSVSAGLMGAYSLMIPIVSADDFSSAHAIKSAALATCKALCPPLVSKVKFADQQFCETYEDKGANRDIAANYNFSELCPDAQKDIGQKQKAIAEIQRRRYQFPILDVSLWIGGGSSQFNYYLQQAAATTTMPASFASKSDWDPHWGTALQLTSVPPMPDKSPIAITFEVPLYFRQGSQASKTVGSACSPKGVLASDGSTLSSCAATEPIGAPKFGTVLSVEGYLGLADRSNAYWRVAFGFGYTHDWVTSLDTYAIKVPFYVNATALGGAKNDASSKQKTDTPVEVDYAGVVRLTPTFQTTSAPNQTPAWAVLLNLELLGQRNLFARADVLVK